MGSLSKNFDNAEFACPCCGYSHIHPGMGVIAELIRHHEGDKPMSPNSGCRCLEYNEIVQKEYNPDYVPFSSESKHMPKDKDGAIDEIFGITIAGDFASNNPKRLYDFLDNLFSDTYGIGLYSWGIHIDLRPEKARW